MQRNFMPRRLIAAAGLVAIGALTISCAASGAAPAESEGDGLPFGASKSDYQAAFADVEPIELVFQSGSGAGGSLGQRDRDYVEAVSDWSDGKVTIKLAWAGEIAPPAETIAALQDGRLDMTHALPQYLPEEFPAYDEFLKSTPLSQTNYLVTALQAQTWGIEVFNSTPELVQEMDENGLHTLAINVGFSGIWCTEPLSTADDFQGRVIATGTAVGADVAAAIGASPTSLPFSEYYEALQRGVIDCVMTGPEAAQLVGVTEVAPHLITLPPDFMALGFSPFATSKTSWESLPLIAQQVLYDRLDVYLTSNAGVNIEAFGLAADALTKHGGTVSEPDDDIVKTVNKLIEDEVYGSLQTATELDGELLFETAKTAADDSNATVREFLGVGNEDISILDLSDWMDEHDPDLAAYTKQMFEDILLPYRPD